MSKISQSELARIENLYTIDKKSMADIASLYNVSFDAIRHFMDKNKIKRRKIHESNREKFLRSPLSFKYNNPNQTSEAIFLMLYWAEGSKSEKNGTLDFANSDPRLVVIFLKVFLETFTIDQSKLRCYLYCHENQDKEELIRYWSNLLHIPVDQFTKPYIKKIVKVSDRKMTHGLVHIRYNDKRLLSEVKKMIGLYGEKYAPVV